MSRLYVRDSGLWKHKGRSSIGSAVPYRPTNPVSSSITNTTFTFSWQAATTPDPAKPVTAYRVYRDNVLVATLGVVLTTNQTGLTAGSIYTYQVAAVNSDGESLKSYPITVTMTGTAPPGGVPGAPTIIDGSQMLSATSARINWSAPTTGGDPTGYKVFRGGTLQIGSNLASNVFTYTETGLPDNGQTFNYTVKAFNASGDGPASTNLPLTWNDIPNPTPLHVGHTPYTVRWGFAAPETGANFRPLWDSNPSGPANSFGSAITIVGGDQNVKVRRYFVGNWISANELNGWLDNADSHGVLMWGSFKSSDWAGVANGNYDANLNTIRDIAKSRRAAGKPPFWMTFDHEPHGNRGGGTAASEPERWVAMQLYCSDYFAGIKNGVYNASNDVKDIMAWTSISNGQWWKPNQNAEALDLSARYHPQTLINKMRTNKGILATDSYDAMPGGGINGSTYTRTQNEKIEGKIQKYIDWHRAKNCGAIGWGEIGTTTSTAGGGSQAVGSLTQCWNIIRDNRDIVTVVNYFNSGANSRWDWRLIPSNYPVTGGTGVDLTEYWPGDGHEIGGTAVTGARLAEYIDIVEEARTPPWNSPP